MLCDSTEEWKPVLGLKFIEASNLGRIRRSPADPTWRSGFIYSQKVIDKGYHVVMMKTNGKRRWHRVHRLVAEAFHGCPAPGMTVNHIDGVKSNNRPENLEYMTISDNVRHAWNCGLMEATRNRVIFNIARKLTDDQVASILSRVHSESLNSLAREFSVSVTTICKMRHGRLYGNRNL